MYGVVRGYGCTGLRLVCQLLPSSLLLSGSAEGFNKADRDINTAVKSGRWVMLENVHLAPGWLMQLEKKLHSMQPHASFRLFLTMEINPKVTPRPPPQGSLLGCASPALPGGHVLPGGFSGVTLCLVCAQVPVNLLRAGRIFVFEPPPGVKANMLRTFSSIPVARMCKVTAPHNTDMKPLPPLVINRLINQSMYCLKCRTIEMVSEHFWEKTSIH